MLSYKESLKILKETNALLEGHFILSSGLHSAQYVQCAQLLSKPKKAEKICLALADKIKNQFSKIDLILALFNPPYLCLLLWLMLFHLLLLARLLKFI